MASETLDNTSWITGPSPMASVTLDNTSWITGPSPMASVTLDNTSWITGPSPMASETGITGHLDNKSLYVNHTFEDLVILLPNSLVFLYNVSVTYIAFVIWLVAVPANILIISILVKKKHRNSSTTVYFLSLAFADLCVNFRTLNFWLVRSQFVKYSSDFECQIEKGYPLLGMLASSWTLASISTERMLSVCIPYKMKYVCTVNVARGSVVFIWMLSISLALLNGWFHQLGTVGCDLKKEHSDVFIEHISYIDYCLDVVVPFFIILFNSAVTIFRLRFRKSSFTTVSKAFGKSVTVLVLFVNAAFFITQVPYGIVFIVQLVNAQSASKLRILYLYHLEGILLVLKYVNYALNFYIYFLTASKFRLETKKIILQCKERCRSLCN